MTHRPFRFGIFGRKGTARTWPDFAREAEQLGYDTLVVPDHLDDQLATVPLLTAAAMATSTLRIGSLVFCNDYKHPAVLAKEAATLDVLSGGRFELGLGAGWTTVEYDRAGLPFDPPGVRIDRMIEGLTVIKGLMAEGPFSFEGTHYHVKDLDGAPKPVQRPHPPILIGGGGKRVLTTAGRLADIVSINVDLRGGVLDARVGGNATRAATEQKIAWIREGAGERFPHVEIEVSCFSTTVTEHRSEAIAKTGESFHLPPEEVVEVPHFLIGSVSEIVDTLEARRAHYGISYIIVMDEVMRDMAPVVARLRRK